MGIFDGLLDGLGWIWNNTVGAAGNALWDEVIGGLVGWVTDAIAWFAKALLAFFEKSSTPDLTSNWFSGGGRIGAGAQSPYGVVAWLALSVLVLFVLVGLIQGLLAGEGPAMAARIARDVPLAILGIVATLGVTQVLLGATDELAAAVLDHTQAGANAKTVLEHLVVPATFNFQASFVVFLLGLVAVLGAFLLWVELLIRASLLYLLLALSPLAYAALLWPAARRMAKGLAELVVALIVSKLVIAIALAVAASALTQGPSATGGVASGEQKIGTLLVGVIMFCLASFAPFVILKLLPVVEGAVIAQGISRAPIHTAERAAWTSFNVARLATGTGTAGGGSGAASGAGAAANGSGAQGSASGSSAATRTVPGMTPRDPATTGTGDTPSARPRASSASAGSVDPPAHPSPQRALNLEGNPPTSQPGGRSEPG